MLRRIAAAIGGRDISERLSALERAVRKLGEAGRDQTTMLQQRLAAVDEALAAQPTAKDLRELRQALRAGAPPTDHQHLFDAIEQIGASGKSIIIGPWTGEVGFELLYWIPFVEWARSRGRLDPAREIVVSRGGVESWYGRSSRQYHDAFASVGVEDFRAAVGADRRKHRSVSPFDERLIADAARQYGLTEFDLLHPGLMFRAFAAYLSEEAGYTRIDQFTRHRLLQPPARDVAPADLPDDYVAVRFYFSESFPASPENRAFAQAVVSNLAERGPVVVLSSGARVDEHDEWLPGASGRVITLGSGLPADRNLAVQSAVIGHARAFVGTYGGYSYLAPLYRVPAVAFYSKAAFKLHHLHAAQRAFADIGAAALTPIDVAQAALVQSALGALAAA